MDDIQEKEQSLNKVLALMTGNKPAAAAKVCREYLSVSPGCIDHLRMLSHAAGKLNLSDEAKESITFAIELRPGFAPLHEDLGALLVSEGRLALAIESFEKAVRLDPSRPTAHKRLGQALAAAGRGEEADDAFEAFFEKDPGKGAVAVGAEHYRAGRLDQAIEILREALRVAPDNVDAMRFLAQVYVKKDTNLGDAEALLRRAVQIAPDFMGASLNLGVLLVKNHKYIAAIDVYRDALKLNDEAPEAWACLGSAEALAGHPDPATEAFSRSIELSPNIAGTHMSLAHALKTLGDQPAALREYRKAVELKPDFGESYWSMANLKIFNFEDHEVASMEQQLETGKLDDSADVHFRFSLGKAYEDKKDYEKAWHYYHSGNQKQRGLVGHDPIVREIKDRKIIEIFSDDFVRKQEGHGFDAPDPIFIVGLPRSGSTLVEQILASHSQVEGTAELSELSEVSHQIGRYRTDGVRFPASLVDLSPRDWRGYGKEYLDKTQRHRITDKPFFTDKMPNNFPLVGFVALSMPNAKIINARRHPLDSCLGSYKQLFGRGQNFTYDMIELGMYYEEYHEMMLHWHSVLPGKVLDVHYEETVTDLEGQVHRILDHCGLPFEEQCLRFYETERAVKTASSEQVRQPIYTGGMGKWRKYESHLGEWQMQLADVIDDLPKVVQDAGL